MALPKLLLKLLPFYIVVAVLLVGPLIIERLERDHLIKQNEAYISQAAPLPAVALKGHPVRFEVPRLKMDLKVLDGHFDPTTKTWNLDWADAFWATVTPEPSDQPGMTLIYGHETPEVFWPLYKLVKGDKLLITTTGRLQFEYYLLGTTNVHPDDTSILHSHPDDPELTLLTCGGTFFQYRHLMTFKLLAVHKL